MGSKALDRLIPWVVGALVATIALAAIYGAIQQNNRASADDAPGAVISELVSAGGKDTPGSLPAPRVELIESRMTFYLVYTSDGRAVAGDGYLDGKRARIPEGVLRSTVVNGSDHLTWEPRTGLRFALTTVRDGQLLIAAGQSLTPFEQRTARIGLLLLLGWLLTLATLTGGAILHLIVGRGLDYPRVSR